jgi:catechol 2,3-dioxygenase-like lactoylglutathione lyase family enzyme
MFDHVGVVVKDLKRSASLYAHMLAPLGFRILERHKTGPGEGWVVIGSGEAAAPFFVIGAGRPSFWLPGCTPGSSPYIYASKPRRRKQSTLSTKRASRRARNVQRRPRYAAAAVLLRVPHRSGRQ